MKNINCNPYEKNILNYVLTNLILISHSKKKKKKISLLNIK